MAKTIKDLVDNLDKKIEVKVEDLPSNNGAQYLPNGQIIIDEKVLDDGKLDVFEQSKIVHELSHAVKDEEYLDKAEELEAYKDQIKFLLEVGVTEEFILRKFLPVFDDYKEVGEAQELILNLIAIAKDQLKPLPIIEAQIKKTKNIAITLTTEENQVVNAIKEIANELGINVFLAGGMLRDKILGLPNSDLDFVTNEKSEELALKLAQKYNLGEPIKMDKSGATMVYFNGKNLDFIDAERVFSPLKPSLERGQEAEMSIFLDDAFRRDLTINSLMYNIKTGELIDPTGKGLADIKNGVIRTIIDSHLKYRFSAPDMLRAIRFFATKPNFKFAPGMLEAMTENAHKLKPRSEHGDISTRRIEREMRKTKTWAEWNKMKQVMLQVGLDQYIGKQIEDVDKDKKGTVEYNFEKVSKLELKTVKVAQVKNDKYYYKDGTTYEGESSDAPHHKDSSKILHRVDGPAVEFANGTKWWYLNGKRHREDGPAAECAYGSKYWYLNGRLHREGGPAVELANGTKWWYLNGKRHREDGPAVEYSDGSKEWWYHDRQFPLKVYNSKNWPPSEEDIRKLTREDMENIKNFILSNYETDEKTAQQYAELSILKDLSSYKYNGPTRLWLHMAKNAASLMADTVKGELCVTPFGTGEKVFRENDGHIGYIWKGKPSYFFPFDVYSTVNEQGGREIEFVSLEFNTNQQEAWLDPSKSQLIGLLYVTEFNTLEEFAEKDKKGVEFLLSQPTKKSYLRFPSGKIQEVTGEDLRTKEEIEEDFLEQKVAYYKQFKTAQVSEQQIQGPTVIIEPSIQSEIQDAVNELKKADSNFFKGVSKIVALSGSPFGQVSSDDPTVIHLNLNKIKQEVKTQVGSYDQNNPEHKKIFDEAVKRSIVETISHEKGHIETYDSDKNQFVGGESPAEAKSRQMMQRMQLDKPIELKSSFKPFCKRAEWTDELLGGLGDDMLPWEFNEDQLVKGLKVELEHTNDPKIALEIVVDHLMENDRYYDYLEEMEKKFEEGSKR